MTLTYSLVLEVAAAIVTFVALMVVLSSIRVIKEDESGLVIKRFGQPLASGRIIALNGEAGYQATLLSPGWHFGLWRWQYKVERIPMVVVEPGEIAVVVAADGEAIPPERVLARSVPCDHFQDAEGFLRNHGERGRQIAVLTAGTYRINPALFEVVTSETAKQHDMRRIDVDLPVEDVRRGIGRVDLRDQRLGQKLRRIGFLRRRALTTRQRHRHSGHGDHTCDFKSTDHSILHRTCSNPGEPDYFIAILSRSV